MPLTPEIEAKLLLLARQQGREAAQVVREWVEWHLGDDGAHYTGDRLQRLLADFEEQAPGPAREIAREQARDELEAMLLDGLDAGEPVDVNAAMWDELRCEAHAELRARGRVKPAATAL